MTAEITDLADVAAAQTILNSNVGKAVHVISHSSGVHRPDLMLSTLNGAVLNIPAGTQLVAVGTVLVHVNNPSRGLFNLAGDGARLDGVWQIVGDYDGSGGLRRPDMGWKYADTAQRTEMFDWIDDWNVVASANLWTTLSKAGSTDFQARWNDKYTFSKIEALGPLSGPNRNSAVITYDHHHVKVSGSLYVENMQCGVCAQGMTLTADNWLTTNSPGYPGTPPTAEKIEAAKRAIQTVGVEIGDIEMGPDVFAPVLSKKQRSHRVGRLTGEVTGHRIGNAQPHGEYFSNELSLYEETHGLHVDLIDVSNYDGGTVFKAKGVKGLTWGKIFLNNVHSALSITLGTTGVGGDVIIRNQHFTTDSRPEGAGSKYAINIVGAPGFILGGEVICDQLEDSPDLDQMKLISVEFSPGFQMARGFRFRSARTTDTPIAEMQASPGCRIGFCDYEDSNGNGGPVWSLGSGGGGSSDCLFEGFRTVGTNQLVRLNADSSGTVVKVVGSLVDGFDPGQAMVNDGLGQNNRLLVEDLSLSTRSIDVAYASTDILQTAAASTLVLDTLSAGIDDDLGKPINPPASETVTIGGQTYTFSAAAGLIAANTVLTDSGGDADKTIKNLSQAIKDSGVEGVSGAYGTGTVANANVTALASGPVLNVRALIRSSAGNSIAVSKSTLLEASWPAATLFGGGLYDAEKMNCWRRYTTTSGSITVTLPPNATTPVGAWVGFDKMVAANSLIIKDSAAATILTLYRAGDRFLLRNNGASWDVIAAAPAWLQGASQSPLPAYAWASLPVASALPGQTVTVTDVGVGAGSLWISNGSTWDPTGPIILARSAVQSAGHTGTTTETVIAGYTVPAGLLGLNRSLRVDPTWSMPANANSKTFRARFGATSGAGTNINSTGSISTTLSLRLSGTITNRNSTTSHMTDANNLIGNGGASTTGIVTGSVNSAAASYVSFTAQLGTTSDTVYLERYQVELLP